MATKTLAKLKAEMLFNQDLTRLVDVMKGVAAAQYHVMEHKLTDLKRYSKAIEELYEVYDFRLSRHPFIRLANKRKLICLVTTDSGFLGGLNMKVVQMGMRFEEENTRYLVIGERGGNYLKEFGKDFVSFGGINADNTRFDLIEQVLGHIVSAVVKGESGQVILITPHAVSFTLQRVEALNLVPCPLFFKDRPSRVPAVEEQARQVILESSDASVIESLATLWLRKRLIETFEDAKLAEYGARTMHLEESFQTLSKINKQLKLDFFKARREKIDQSLRESFTSQLLCKNVD